MSEDCLLLSLGDAPVCYKFSKKHKLLKAYQFRRVQRYGRLASGRYLAIQFCKGEGEVSQLGLTVSRKFGNAAQRNRFKRLVREAFRLSQHRFPFILQLNIRPTQSATLIGLEQLSLSSIQQELLHLLPQECPSRA